MTLPKRLNLIRIVLGQLDKTSTFVDDDFRQQVGAKRRFTEVIVQGQINIGLRRGKKLAVTARGKTGDEEKSRGHCLFRRADLKKQGVVIQKGDQILRVGPTGDEVVVNGVVIEIRPESPLRGAFLLDYVEFEHDLEELATVR